MRYHYPPVEGFAKRQPKQLPEQLFSDSVLDQPSPTGRKLRPRKKRAKTPTTLCGLTSPQPTRTERVDCEACLKVMDAFPQLGNRVVSPSTLADSFTE